MFEAMTPEDLLNTAVPWITAVVLVIWFAVFLIKALFGKDDD